MPKSIIVLERGNLFDALRVPNFLRKLFQLNLPLYFQAKLSTASVD